MGKAILLSLIFCALKIWVSPNMSWWFVLFPTLCMLFLIVMAEIYFIIWGENEN